MSLKQTLANRSYVPDMRACPSDGMLYEIDGETCISVASEDGYSPSWDEPISIDIIKRGDVANITFHPMSGGKDNPTNREILSKLLDLAEATIRRTD